MSTTITLLRSVHAATVAIRTDPELRFIMGAFPAAEWDSDTQTYALAETALDDLRIFARTRQLSIRDDRELAQPWDRAARDVLNEWDRERHDIDEQSRINARGIALCRLNIRRARLLASRERS